MYKHAFRLLNFAIPTDPAIEKHSMHTITDQSSNNMSMIKGGTGVSTLTGTYTGTSSEVGNSSEDEREFTRDDDWDDSTNLDAEDNDSYTFSTDKVSW